MSTDLPASCPHAETTTLLWLYGEAPEEHVHHVADCEACSQVVALHADVTATVAGVAGELSFRDAPPVPSVLVAPEPEPAPANRGWLLGVVVGLAVAAALLLGLVGVLGLPGAAPAPLAEGPAGIQEPGVAPPAPDPVPQVAPLERALVQDQGVPRQVAPLDDVDLDVLVAPDTAEPSVDARVAGLEDDALYAPLDDELDALFDDFAALEADLTTL